MILESDLFCYCNLPALPKEVEDSVRKSAELGFTTGHGLQFFGRKEHTPKDKVRSMLDNSWSFILDGKSCKHGNYKRYFTDPLVTEWVKENIISDMSRLSVQTLRDGAMIPHTDGPARAYILNYTIETGGDNAELQWYQEPGFPVIRPGDALQYKDPSMLQKIASSKAKQGAWIMMFGQVFHTVVGIESPRIQLSIGLTKEEFLQLKEKYKLDLKYYG